MFRMIDEYGYDPDFNALLKSFMKDKEHEDGLWSQLTLCTHHMMGGRFPHIHRLAAATELMMLTLDIVDDVQDQDHRSKPWMQCPEAISLNAVLAFLMGILGELGKLQMDHAVLVEISTIIARAVNGQQRDVTNRIVDADDYLAMTQEKSGSLFRFACFMGYSSAGCSKEAIQLIEDLADCIGLIHQIQNDMRDFMRWDMKNDLLSRKRTLPALYLLSIEDPAFAPFKSYYDGHILTDEFLREKDKLVQIINDSGCMEYTRIVQSVCIQKAEEMFDQLPALAPWKQRFKELTFGAFVDKEL